MNSNPQPGANDDSSIYTNHPLGARTTRVVHIVSPEEHNATETISLHLSVISMDPPPNYRAVSYVWGDPDVTETILVDGQPFCIRINLWHFLAQMCKEGYRGALWIDAICINQNDLEERNQQVAFMGNIFSQAKDVRAWLGVGTAQNWLGIESLNGTDWLELWAFFAWESDDEEDHDDDHEDHDDESSGTSILTLSEDEDYINRLLSVTANDFLAPVLELIDLPYWSRVWIVQEFLLAQNLSIQSGGYLTTASTFRSFTMCMGLAKTHLQRVTDFTDSASFQNWLDTRDLLRDFIATDYSHMAIWLTTKKFLWGPESGKDDAGFAALIVSLRQSECADFHDYIYAVRSLAAVALEHIIPDYTKSKLELFLDVTALLAITYGHQDRYSQDIIYRAAKSLRDRFELDQECEEVRKALAAVPYPGPHDMASKHPWAF